MKTAVKVSDTRQPRLTRAVLAGVDREQLEDVCRGGADAGWNGFTCYSDTVAFYKVHKADILKRAEEDSKDFGQDMIEMIRGFRCLGNQGKPDYSTSEIAEALYAGRGECSDVIRNAMAWYALEEIARELNPEL